MSNSKLHSARILQAAPHNRYQPHVAEPEQYTICSDTVFVLQKMGMMMPETCWDGSW